MAAIGAVEAEEAGGEVAAAEEVADGGEDVGAEWSDGGAVVFLVGGEEGVPSGGDQLREYGAGTVRLTWRLLRSQRHCRPPCRELGSERVL